MTETNATQHVEHAEPYVVYRVLDKQLECALWTLRDGTRTLALFLKEAAARHYCQAAQLDPQWKPLRPEPYDLLAIIRASYEAGIHWAALDPDDRQARRLFDLREVVRLNDTDSLSANAPRGSQ